MNDTYNDAPVAEAATETLPLAPAPTPEAKPRKPRATAKPAQGGMDFSSALVALKMGLRMQREGWNGKGMFIYLVQGSTFTVDREPLLSIMGKGATVNYHPHIDMKTADGQCVPWLASQTDLLASDWQQLI